MDTYQGPSKTCRHTVVKILAKTSYGFAGVNPDNRQMLIQNHQQKQQNNIHVYYCSIVFTTHLNRYLFTG